MISFKIYKSIFNYNKNGRQVLKPNKIPNSIESNNQIIVFLGLSILLLFKRYQMLINRCTIA